MDKKGLTIRVDRNTGAIILMIILLIEGNYWSLIPYIVPYTQAKRNIGWFVIILAITMLMKSFRINKSLLIWIPYMFLMLVRNQEFANGENVNTLRLVLCLLSVFVACSGSEWTKRISNLIIGIGFANVIATILFFINNNLYESFILMTYGTYQTGSGFGTTGYKVGLADNYSQNGTYISIVLLALGAILICHGIKKKRGKVVLILAVMTTFALLITTKRGHLLFVVTALIFGYCIAYRKGLGNKVFNLLIITAIIAVVGAIAIEIVPSLSAVFDRFQTIGIDTSSTYRLLMWEYAFNLFKRNPIFGIGWYGFRYESNILSLYSAAYTGTHNIYLELLCECGILGFIVFLLASITTIYSTIKKLLYINRTGEYTKYQCALLSSFLIQLFCLMYGFTGNPIYDRTFNFYAIALAINASIQFQKTNSLKMDYY